MQLKNTALAILSQLQDLLSQLTNDEYSASLALLSENSISKHVRHVLEFFDLLVSGNSQNEINYDDRSHDELLESNLEVAKAKIDEIADRLLLINKDKKLILKVSYDVTKEESHFVETSINRELAYNIEHAIHHMAIVKIAVRAIYPRVKLPDTFGVAYSTIRYQKSNA